MLAPICLFTYNRLNETRQTVEALKRNFLASSSELFVFSDGPKNEANIVKVEEVRQYLRSIRGFKNITIKESPENKGLANSIINGVSLIIEKYEKVIVLEDDLISQPNFLNFMNQTLDFYNQEKRIQSINGYSLKLEEKTSDVYFQVRPFPWGWATWADRWNKSAFNKQNLKAIIESDRSILTKFKKSCGDDISKMLVNSISNKNDSWYVRWTFDHFRNNKYSLFPQYSFIKNIGHSSNGTHCKGINTYFSIPANDQKIEFDFLDFQPPKRKLQKDFLRYFTIRHKLKVRIELLTSVDGRRQVIEEFKLKIGQHD